MRYYSNVWGQYDFFQKFIFLFTKDALKSEYNDYNITKGLYLK